MALLGLICGVGGLNETTLVVRWVKRKADETVCSLDDLLVFYVAARSFYRGAWIVWILFPHAKLADVSNVSLTLRSEVTFWSGFHRCRWFLDQNPAGVVVIVYGLDLALGQA